MHSGFLGDLIVVLGLSTVGILLFTRIRLPAIVGFILTGILAGPHGFKLIEGVSDVESMAELGVVLLLFSIGIEFSLKDLLQIRRNVLLGGSIQVGSTLTITYLLSRTFGLGFSESLLIGFIVSMSSTAIVLKLLDERAEITSPHGKNSLSILIFQDLIVVPIMLLIPLLSGTAEHLRASPVIFLLKGFGLIGLFFLSYKWIVPALLFQIARTKSRELFLISIILICFAVAWLTSLMGLSLALGAFLAGLIISESEYSQEALGRILPFRDIFVSFFFVSIGMLLNLSFLMDHVWIVLLCVCAVIVIKTITGGFATLILGYPLRIVVITGLCLAQVGEFSFLLSTSGLQYGILDPVIYQLCLDISLLTMAAAPFLINASGRFADRVVALPFPQKIKCGLRPLEMTAYSDGKPSMKDHLIIIGYGVNGRNVSRAARFTGIPYLILEMNPETVRSERAKGEPIYYGDATQDAILEHVDIRKARVMVIAIPDAAAVRRITATARNLNEALHIIARTRYVTEVGPLYQLGADEVIPEEFETSIEIFSRALAEYLVPRDDIERFIADLRSDGYKMFRSLSGEATSIYRLEQELPEFKISTLKVHEGSVVSGKTLQDLELRKKYRVSILAIRREGKTILNPGGEDTLMNDDVLVISGQIQHILNIIPLLKERSPGLEPTIP
ncbi:MAG: cation:proton antiporter [Desulfomonilia bacterium]